VGFLTLGGNGSYNTAVGATALNGFNSGVSNIAFGMATGQDLSTGNSNIYLDKVNPTAASEDVTIRVGELGLTDRAFIGGIFGGSILGNALQVFIDVEGKLATMTSSRRYKEDIRHLGPSSARLFGLRPVSFRYRSIAGDRTRFGLIAEEVESVFPELVTHDPEGRAQSVRYQELPALLLEELQQQESAIEAQDVERRRLEDRAAELHRRAEEVSDRLHSVRTRFAEIDASTGTKPEEVAP
jgi:hypothetical protein